MTELLALIVLIPLAAAVGVVVKLGFRNNAVYDYMIDLNNEIHRLDTEDADEVHRLQLSGDHTAEYAPSWRRKELKTISSDKMFWQFWRPLRSFHREGFPKEPK